MQRAVRTMPVVVLEVLLQRRNEVAGSNDQEMVEAFTAQRANEAFRDRVCPGCLHRLESFGSPSGDSRGPCGARGPGSAVRWVVGLVVGAGRSSGGSRA